ncbi:MAG TPA: Ig-like domain-containing protein [Gemmatimonadales bacterium]|nr:Ig-like domain-containing protein [Gemmatimonadales bacterium]
MKIRTLCCVLALAGAACTENGQPSGSVDSLSTPVASLTLAPFETYQLSAAAFGADDSALTIPISWRSADTTIATVSDSGEVVAKAEGNVSLIAKAESESVTVALRVVSSFTAVAFTESASCALRTTGTVWCWGGQWPATGAALAGGGTFQELAGGGVSYLGRPAFCGLTSGGSVACWGEDGNPPLLGVGSDTGYFATAPVAVTGGFTAVLSVGVGYFQACLVTAGGSLYCWGRGNHGEAGVNLGGGFFIASVPDSVLTTVKFAQITPARYFTCGLTGAGAAYCWGSNSWGAVGNDTSTEVDVLVPVPVAGGHVFTKLVAGYDHPCGLTTDSEIWCWAENDEGEAGSGVVGQYLTSPVHSAPSLHFTDLAGGDDVTCGIATDSLTYCWGAGAGLGAGDAVVGGDFPNPVAVAGHHRFVHLFSGRGAVCGVTVGGAAYCWGKATNGGNLGDGVTVSSTVPIRVLDP